MKKAALLPVLLVPMLAACGKEVGRVPLKGEGQAEASLQASGKPLAFWTSLDMKYKGTFDVKYEVTLLQDGKEVGKTSCDAFDVNVKTGAKELTIGDARDVSYDGKMKCELTPPKAGPTVVRAKVAYLGNPRDLAVKDLSLVVKE